MSQTTAAFQYQAYARTFETTGVVVPPVSWLAHYPDRIDPPRGLASTAQLTLVENISPLPNPAAPALSWHPAYPDRINPLVSLGAPSQVEYVTNHVIIINVAQATAWRPYLPVYIWPRTALKSSAQRTYTNVISPLPNAAPPVDLTWKPAFPAFLRPPLRVLAPPTVTSFLGPPFADTRWKALYPDRLTRSTFLTAEQRAYFQGDQFAGQAIPRLGGWRPVYPAWLRTSRPLNTGVSAWVVDASILMQTVLCATWEDRTMIDAYLSNEATTHAAVETEVGRTSAFSNEQVC